jgi:thiamine pyridinylase
VVEVDTLLMGTLVANNWVKPLNIQPPGILPAAWQAASVDGQTYGVPTYLCSNVIYAYDSGLTAVRNGAELLTFLSSLSANTPLAGNYAGSWTLPGSYLDAWADTNGTAGLAGAYLPPVDATTMSSFAPLVNSCATATANPCLDGTYANGTGAETAFATGQANGFVGYTERLFYILTTTPQTKPSLISAPLGGGSHPVMYVDALVVNPNCTGTCLTQATAFIQFMSQLSTRNLIAFSQDAPSGTFPRYLQQANADFYSSTLAQQDPFYPQFWSFLQNAVPFPNRGFPESRLLLGPAIKAALGADSTAIEKHH